MSEHTRRSPRPSVQGMEIEMLRMALEMLPPAERFAVDRRLGLTAPPLRLSDVMRVEGALAATVLAAEAHALARLLDILDPGNVHDDQ